MYISIKEFEEEEKMEISKIVNNLKNQVRFKDKSESVIEQYAKEKYYRNYLKKVFR